MFAHAAQSWGFVLGNPPMAPGLTAAGRRQIGEATFIDDDDGDYDREDTMTQAKKSLARPLSFAFSTLYHYIRFEAFAM